MNNVIWSMQRDDRAIDTICPEIPFAGALWRELLVYRKACVYSYI
jgi:hypothetical protein